MHHRERRMIHTMTRPKWCLSARTTAVYYLVCLVSRCGLAFAEATSRVLSNNSISDNSTTTDQQYQDNLTEQYVVATVSFLSAACVSLLCAGIAFFCIREDALYRRFWNEGTTLEASKVVNVVTLQQHNSETRTLSASCKDQPPSKQQEINKQQQVLATVDYRYIEAGGYTTMVRKQMKCRPSDIVNGNGKEDDSHHGRRRRRKQLLLQIDLSKDEVFSFDAEDLCAVGFGEDTSRTLDVLILDNYPTSGIPKDVVQRARHGRGQKSTIAVVLALLSLCFFCIHVGLKNSLLPRHAYDEEQSYSDKSFLTAYIGHSLALSMVCTLLLFAVNLLLVKVCGQNMVQEALHNEYLESGGKMLIKLDDETLSTHASTHGSWMLPNSGTLTSQPSMCASVRV